MINLIKSKYIALIAIIMVFMGCERDLSGDAEFATYPMTGDIFFDDPIGLGNNFYFPYADSYFDAFSVDNEVAYEGRASIRIDVPNASNTNGNYAGGIWKVDGGARNLTSFDALTFYAKASQAVSIAEIGFGEDFVDNKWQTTRYNLELTTNWEKYIIPIPDPSKLVNISGLLRYAAGSQGTDGAGYSFWLDNLQFEKLGTVAQARPAIFEGSEEHVDSFNGVQTQITGLTQTFNTANEGDITVSAAPAYYSFTSSNTAVAIVNEMGLVSTLSEGSATVTANLGGVKANGALLLNSLGNFTAAPVPTVPAADVISVFSDAYTNVPVDFYNGYYAPYQTTTSSDFVVNGDNVLNYQNFNFVGIEFNQNVPEIDASAKNTLHFDLFIPETVNAATTFQVDLRDFGADAGFDGGDDTVLSYQLNTSDAPVLTGNQWISVDMDISTMANRNRLGQIVFVGSETGPSAVYMDNIYFY